jgi:endoglucanase
MFAMKQVLNILIFLWAALLALPAMASDVIMLKRGLPTDIWLTWPGKDGLDDPKMIEEFPEYRQEYKGTEFGLVKAAGFDFVRLTVDPAVFLTKRRLEKTAVLLKGVKAAVDEILAAGLKVDVDMHIYPRDDGSPGTRQVLASDALFAEYLKVLADVGKLVSRYPSDKVAFEVLNEPTIDCTYDMPENAKPEWPAKLVRLHDTARAAAPRQTLILSGACWGGYEGLVALDPALIADTNVIWSFHNYEPFVFTHQGASWNDGHERYLEGLRFPPDVKQKKAVLAAALKAIDRADLSSAKRKQLKTNARNDLRVYFEPGWAESRAKQGFVAVEAWAKSHGISADRILLGEFGAIRPRDFTARNERERAVYYRMMRTEAERRGYGWSTWEWKTEFGLSKGFDTREFDPLMVRALMGTE